MLRFSTIILIVPLFLSLTVVIVIGQEFQREIHTIPVIIDGIPVPDPFTGGGSYSKPTFADIDNDGDLDLFLGQEGGNIEFYRNMGTATNPNFRLETQSLASIDVGSANSPTLVDIDDDGDLDLFIGEGAGNIHFYRNTGADTNPNFTLETENLASIDVGTQSTPTFADIDNDGDLDLFVGERGGNINFYSNIGTIPQINFTFETEFFALVDVGDRSYPSFVDIDNDGDLDLFVGEQSGNINFLRNTGTITDPNFTLEKENFASIDIFTGSSTPTFPDIDNDGDLDLFVGGTIGRINFYRNTGSATNPDLNLETENLLYLDLGNTSTPTLADIDDDGDLDLFVGVGGFTNINFFFNTGTVTNPNFALETDSLASIDVGTSSSLAFADIDDDGDLDLFIGETDGNINFFRNTGTATGFAFILETENFASIDVGIRSKPTFADIDDDGDFDLFVGEMDGNINFYRNAGTATSHTFTFESENFAFIDVGFESAPNFADIDDDGDLDLFIGEGGFGGVNINFYRNTGTATEPNFTLETENFAAIDVGHGGNSVPYFADIDNDGDLDIFLGEGHGGLHFYRNTTPVNVTSPEIGEIPKTFDLSQNYPNPFNPETTIQYHLPSRSQIKLVIFNQLGQHVSILVDEVQSAGIYSIQWDGKDQTGRLMPSAVYLYRLETKEFIQVKKLTLLR